MNALNDVYFLKQLDLNRNQKIFARVILLNQQEQPVEQFEGKITQGGSINKDGASAVRRTGSLTIQTDDLSIHQSYWSLKNKIKIFIGVENNINDKYDNIIWFNQGVFILTQFNLTHNINNYSISISCQDKMCLLNGTIGGTLPASIDFQKQDLYENTYEKCDFGKIYQKNQYYTLKNDNISISLCQNKDFDIDEVYYSKVYDYYQKILLDKNTYEPDYYYTVNTELYTEVKKDDNWKPNYTYYTYNTQLNKYVKLGILAEHKFQEYKQNSTQLYITNTYIPIKENDGFNRFEKYYILNDNGIFEQVEIDEGFSSDIQYYKENIYILSTEGYNDKIMYYEKISCNDYVINKNVNKYNYQPNTYYFYNISNEELILDNNEYDKTKKYYEQIEIENGYKKIELGETQYLKDIQDGKQYYFYIGDSYIKDPFTYYTQLYGPYYEKEKKYKRVIFNEDISLYKSNYYYTYDETKGFVLDNGVEYDPKKSYYQKNIIRQFNYVPIKTIVRELIHFYGQEPYHNIIINDIDDYGLLLKEYRGEDPLYILSQDGNIFNVISGDARCYPLNVDKNEFLQRKMLYEGQLSGLQSLLQKNKITQEQYEETTIEAYNNFISDICFENFENTDVKLSDNSYLTYDSLINEYAKKPTQIVLAGDDSFQIYTVIKLEYGDAAGYELTELTYPGQLVSSIGDSVCSILDKIKSQFSNFEYFYDEYGRFIFQKKKDGITTVWNNIINNEENEIYVDNFLQPNDYVYNFENNEQVISISNTPKLNEVKNDYVVWGERNGVGDVKIPICGRLAIDSKPQEYISFPLQQTTYKQDDLNNIEIDQQIIKTTLFNNDSNLELLIQNKYYSFNSEYYKQHYKADNKNEIIDIHPVTYQNKVYAGVMYNIIYCDWREIIYQMAKDYYQHNQEDDYLINLKKFNPNTCDNYSTGYERYYVEIFSFWKDIYNLDPEIRFNNFQGGYGEYYKFDNNYGFVKQNGWQEPIYDYSDLQCDFYLPTNKFNLYYNNAMKTKREYETLYSQIQEYDNNIKKFYSKELDKLQKLNAEYADYQKSKQTKIDERNSDLKIISFNQEIKNLQEIQYNNTKDRNKKITALKDEITELIKSFGLTNYMMSIPNILTANEEIIIENNQSILVKTITANNQANQAVVDWVYKQAINKVPYKTYNANYSCSLCHENEPEGFNYVGFCAAAYAHGTGDAALIEQCFNNNGKALIVDTDCKKIVSNWFNQNGKNWKKYDKIEDIPIGTPAIVIYGIDNICYRMGVYVGNNLSIVEADPDRGVVIKSINSDKNNFVAAFAYTGKGIFEDKIEKTIISEDEIEDMDIDVSGSNAKAQKIVKKALELAWPLGTPLSKSNYKTGAPTSKYVAAFKKYAPHKNTKANYSDCGMTMTTIVRAAGIDSDFKGLQWSKPYNPNIWTIAHKGSGLKESKLKPADIIQYKKTNGHQHVFMYIGNGKYVEGGRRGKFCRVFTYGPKKWSAGNVKKSTLTVIRVKG